MKLRTVSCPDCEKDIDLDIDLGLEHDCPKCGSLILLANTRKKKKRRSGVKIGLSVYGTAMRENEAEEARLAKLDAQKKLHRAKRKNRSSSKSSVDSDDEFNDIDPELEKAAKLLESTEEKHEEKFRKRLAIRGTLVALTCLGVGIGSVILKRRGNEAKPDELLTSETLDDEGVKQGREIDYRRLSAPLQTDTLGIVVGRASPGDNEIRLIPEALKSLGMPEEASARVNLARAVAVEFLSAPTWKDRLPMIRNLERVAPDIQSYSEVHGDKPLAFSSVGFVGIEDKTPRFCAFSVRMADGTDRMIGLEYTEDGYKVDWYSFVIHSEMEWSQFMATQPKLARRFRVLVRQSNYYNFGYEEDKYACYEINSPHGFERSVFGYVKRDSALERELRRLWSLAGDMPMPLTLDLSYPRDPKTDNIVQIRQLISNGWFIREEDDAELTEELKGDI